MLKTLLIDIDGTLIHTTGHLVDQITNSPKILPGVIEKFHEWDVKGYNIILTTGRRENLRAITEKQLLEVGIFYDQLIMGIGGGPRVIINDLKPTKPDQMAVAINLIRNTGLKDVDV